MLLAMLGARGHYIVPEIMEELGVLTCFVTDVFIGRHRWLRATIAAAGHILRIGSLRSLAGRSSVRIPIRRVVAFRWLGVRYAIGARFGRAAEAQLFASVNRQFCVKAVPYLHDVDICWAYNGAALELFEAARADRIRCVLEQVSAPRGDERRELVRAAQDYPEWSSAEDLSHYGSSDPLSQRERAEWPLADMIVAGSRFVQGCLERSGIPMRRCTIVPYGIDLGRFTVGKEVRRGGPLRVLFVGRINLSKGVPYILEAVRRLNSSQIELKLIGAVQSGRECANAIAQWASFTGPIPRSEIASYYHWADILVVPSLFEGSATVTYEAKGCGVPIVATPNAGAYFSPGIDGLEIPVRDAAAIASILDRLARDRDEVRSLREGAIANRRSVGRDAYRERIRNVLDAVGVQSWKEQKDNST